LKPLPPRFCATGAVAIRSQKIVESGVFRGLTTWVMRQACPQAEIFCFDPDLSGLRYRDITQVVSPRNTPDSTITSGASARIST
jgi:hypothetical protein